MLKEKLGKIIVTSLVAGSIISSASHAFAAQKTISIPKLGQGYTKISDTRSGKNGYVLAKCVAVYPKGTYDEDNFRNIRVCILDSQGGHISNEKTITEGTGYQKVKLYEHCMGCKNIKFGFCGNSANYAANAIVGYDAK